MEDGRGRWREGDVWRVWVCLEERRGTCDD